MSLTTLAYIGVDLIALAVLVGALYLPRHRHQVILLDRAFADESALRSHLESLLGAQVRSLVVQRLDLVNDVTLVDVRYKVLARRAGSAAVQSHSASSAATAAGEAWTAPTQLADVPRSYQPRTAHPAA